MSGLLSLLYFSSGTPLENSRLYTLYNFTNTSNFFPPTTKNHIKMYPPIKPIIFLNKIFDLFFLFLNEQPLIFPVHPFITLYPILLFLLFPIHLSIIFLPFSNYSIMYTYYIITYFTHSFSLRPKYSLLYSISLLPYSFHCTYQPYSLLLLSLSLFIFPYSFVFLPYQEK